MVVYVHMQDCPDLVFLDAKRIERSATFVKMFKSCLSVSIVVSYEL